MGNFRIEIDGIGGHGCSRNFKDGDIVPGCGEPSCPDCIARKFVAELKEKGFFSSASGNAPRAVFIHWPGSEGSVTDDLLTRIRHGNF